MSQMEDENLLPDTLESIISRIGYGKYHIAVAIVCLLPNYCLGVELILAGIYEKYLINETDLSDTTISTLCTLINSGISIGAAMALPISHLLGKKNELAHRLYYYDTRSVVFFHGNRSNRIFYLKSYHKLRSRYFYKHKHCISD